MGVVREFLRNTQTEPGTGGTVYDLSATQGSSTLMIGSTSSTTSVEVLRFQRAVGSAINSSSFPVSIDVSSVSASTLEAKFRVQRINSSGVVQASSGYSTIFNTAGIKTATLSLVTTWAAGDLLAVSVELRKTGGGGSRSITIRVNDVNGYTDASFGATSTTIVCDPATWVWAPTATLVKATRVQGLAGSTSLWTPTAMGIGARWAHVCDASAWVWTAPDLTLTVTGQGTAYSQVCDPAVFLWSPAAALIRLTRRQVLDSSSAGWVGGPLLWHIALRQVCSPASYGWAAEAMQFGSSGGHTNGKTTDALTGNSAMSGGLRGRPYWHRVKVI